MSEIAATTGTATAKRSRFCSSWSYYCPLVQELAALGMS